MSKVTVTPQAYGFLCEIRNAVGAILAIGFCNYALGAQAKAEAVNRALAQLQ